MMFAGLRSRLRDPFTGSVSMLGALAIAGFAAVALAARGVAATDDVATQLAYVASGALGGLGLVGFAVGLLLVQVHRREDARRRADLERVVLAAADLLATVRKR